MKYIKLFEESNQTIENYFKDKINWKLVNYITDIGTKYEDENYVVNVRIIVSNYRYRKLFQHSAYAVIWSTNSFNSLMNSDITSGCIDSYNEYGLFYMFSVYSEYIKNIEEDSNLTNGEIESLRKSTEYINALKSMKEFQKIMIDKIKNKFNIEVLDKITGEELFRLK